MFKGRVELVISPRCCVWKVSTSYAPGPARSWRHRGEGRLLAQLLILGCGTQRERLGPLGRGVAGNPIPGPGHPSCVECTAAIQLPLAGGGHFSDAVLAADPSSRNRKLYGAGGSRRVGGSGLSPERGVLL